MAITKACDLVSAPTIWFNTRKLQPGSERKKPRLPTFINPVPPSPSSRTPSEPYAHTRASDKGIADYCGLLRGKNNTRGMILECGWAG